MIEASATRRPAMLKSLPSVSTKSGEDQVRATEEMDTVLLVVEDDGPGIPPAERSRVIGRFYGLDRRRSLPGNGLGLSLVSAIVSLHWGQLYLSDAAPGLVARIVLPRVL
jgi:signal transduction histidine kinase